MTLSTRSDVSPFIVMDVVKAAADNVAAGKDVLHLEIGQPGTPAPPAVLAAAERALRTDKLGYTVALGMPSLRKAIAEHYRYYYDVDLSPENVVVTPGSSGAFSLAFLTCFDKGARVGIPAPGYPCYRNILRVLNLEAVDIQVNADTNYLITPALLEKLPHRIDGLVVSSPNNPTGSMYTESELRSLVEYCRENTIQLISDEIYHGISFSSRAASALQFGRDPIVINSFSKYFSMTGWRVGWMVIPREMVRRIERLVQNLYIATSTLSQIGAIEAFKCYRELDNRVMGYKEKRDILCASLLDAGLSDMASPDGAFYLYANVEHLTNDSVAFCQRMLSEIQVAVTPGVDFDPYLGSRAIRFSYAADIDTIQKAGVRLRSWLSTQPLQK